MRPGADPLGAIGVVIVAYRSAAVIAETIDALPANRFAAIVVVDNASPDDSAAVVRAQARPDVTLVVSDTNCGFGGGNNLGVSALPPTATRILFLNPDAVIDEPSVLRLARWLDERPGCALVGARVRSNGQPVTSAGRPSTLLTELRPLLPRALGSRLPARRFDASYAKGGPVGYVEGACMLVDRDRFERAGRFDESFFLYFEELDLANRLREDGSTVDLCPDAWVDHRVAASTAVEPFAARTYIFESSMRYLRKWHHRSVPFLFAAVARASWALRERSGKLDADARTAYGRALRDGARR